jgi:hypothetical protein
MAELKFVIHICRDGVTEEKPIEVPFKKGTYVKVLRPKGKSEEGAFYEQIDGVTYDGSRFTATP